MVREYTAGSPQREVIWTNLRAREIAELMTQRVQEPVSRRVARQLLKRHGFVRRQSQKKKSLKTTPDRNALALIGIDPPMLTGIDPLKSEAERQVRFEGQGWY